MTYTIYVNYDFHDFEDGLVVDTYSSWVDAARRLQILINASCIEHYWMERDDY